jgi:hypothetical protein
MTATRAFHVATGEQPGADELHRVDAYGRRRAATTEQYIRWALHGRSGGPDRRVHNTERPPPTA